MVAVPWWHCVGSATVIGARGDCLRPGSAEFRESLLGFVVPWCQLAGRAQLREFLASLSTLNVLCPTCSRPVPSLLLDAAVQTPLYSVASHDASTLLPLTEFFTRMYLLRRPFRLPSLAIGTLQCWQRLTSTTRWHCYALQPQQRQPRLRRSRAHYGPTCVTTAATGSREVCPVSTPHMVYLLKRHRCDLVCVHPSQSRPHSHRSVPPKWEHILCVSASYLQEKCKYRPSGNPQSCWCRSSSRNWSSP